MNKKSDVLNVHNDESTKNRTGNVDFFDKSQKNNDLTLLINRALDGDAKASEAAFAHTYPHLCRLARMRLGYNRNNTMDTRVVVHESFLRFHQLGDVSMQDRLHFYRYASQVMRSVIVDMARKKSRDGTAQADGSEPDDLQITPTQAAHHILDIHHALESLGKKDPQMMAVVEMKYFAGMNEMEIAEVLDVTDRTVRRIWQRAKIWLRASMDGMEL